MHEAKETLHTDGAPVVNTYIQFPRQRLWGLGQSASADGMKWDLYPQRLMSDTTSATVDMAARLLPGVRATISL
jgi:hypothetical protein